MKVTKYPQSCLLIEKDGRGLVIDPGGFFAAKFAAADLGPVAAVLYTHKHGDHYEPELAVEFLAKGLKLYGNQSVAKLIGPSANAVVNGETFKVAGFEVTPHDLPHCVMPDGSDGPPNTGYIIDGNFFHPGDGIATTGVQVDNLALPITGPSISFYDAVKFADSVGAKKVIPIHYDNIDLFPGNPEGFKRVYTEAEVFAGSGKAAEGYWDV